MVTAVIKREFLDNFISFKFIACVLVAVVLVSISTIVLTKDYRDRLEDYNKGVTIAQESLRKVPVYSHLEVGIFKKPSPLSIFVSGMESRIGNHVYLTHREIPTSLKGGFIRNEFSRMFSFFDLSSVIVIVLTILAILLSYDSVSGEKETGLLSLILSNSLARFKFLLGKYLGGLISIIVPLTLCFAAATLIVLFSKGIEMDSGFFTSVFLIYLFSVIYLSSILLIGIFISSRTKTSFNSLIFLLAFYLISVFLLPIAVRSHGERLKVMRARNYENNVNELRRELNNKIRKLWNEVPVRRSWASQTRIGEKVVLKRINPENTIEFYKIYYSRRERMIEEYALKAHDLRIKDFSIKEKISKINNIFLAFLPSSNFERIAELIAGTGQDSLNRFFNQLNLYWHQYLRYLDEKDAFSLKYFYPYPEQFSQEEKEIIQGINEAFQKRAQWYANEAYKKAAAYNPEIQYLNLDDMPVYKFQAEHFVEEVRFISFNALILIFYNILFFLLGHFSFNRYDPRFEV